MHKKITKTELKKLLAKDGTVEIELFDKRNIKYLNNTSGMITPAMYVTNISDITELETKILDGFYKFCGHKNFAMSVWIDEE